MGEEVVRGIMCDRWQSCIYNEQGGDTFLLDYYFSKPGYKMANGASQVPVRAVLNGSGEVV